MAGWLAMQRAILPILALSLAWLLGAGPAAAQGGTGARVAPARPEGTRPTVPRAPLAEDTQDPLGLLRLAEATLAARRLGDTAELLERAEARLLTRSELASAADRPAVGGAIGELAAARDALARRDIAAAQGLVASAIQRLEAGEAPAVAPAPSSPATGVTVAPGGAAGGVGLVPPQVAGSARPGPAVAGAFPGPEMSKTPLSPLVQPAMPLPAAKPPALPVGP